MDFWACLLKVDLPTFRRVLTKITPTTTVQHIFLTTLHSIHWRAASLTQPLDPRHIVFSPRHSLPNTNPFPTDFDCPPTGVVLLSTVLRTDTSRSYWPEHTEATIKNH
jgi:hypothetical protein